MLNGAVRSFKAEMIAFYTLHFCRRAKNTLPWLLSAGLMVFLRGKNGILVSLNLEAPCPGKRRQGRGWSGPESTGEETLGATQNALLRSVSEHLRGRCPQRSWVSGENRTQDVASGRDPAIGRNPWSQLPECSFLEISFFHWHTMASPQSSVCSLDIFRREEGGMIR